MILGLCSGCWLLSSCLVYHVVLIKAPYLSTAFVILLLGFSSRNEYSQLSTMVFILS